MRIGTDMKNQGELGKNAIFMCISSKNALVNGEKQRISADGRHFPRLIDGKAFVPLKFFCESIGIEAGKFEQMPACRIIDGETYFELTEICKDCGLKLFFEHSLIIYSRDAIKYTWKDNLKELRILCENFLYDDVSGEEIVSKVRERYPQNQHPRLILTEERFRKLRAEYNKKENQDPVYKTLFANLTEICEEALTLPLPTYELRGVRLMYVSDAVQIHCLCLAIMYNITQKKEYAERAKTEILSVCRFSDWHPFHFLDTGIMACTVGFTYDWLYDCFSEEERQLVKKAIAENALKPVMNDYDHRCIISDDQSNPLSRTCHWNGGSGGNWVFVAGGIAIASLAVCDELDGQELKMAERVLSQSLLDIRPAISKFAPDGGYSEGVGYWSFSSGYWQKHVASLLTATGSDYGYFNAPGLSETNAFMLSVEGPAQKFGYHDVKYKGKSGISAAFHFWAERFNHPEEAKARIKLVLENGGSYHDLLFYNPEFIKNDNPKSGKKGSAKLAQAIGVFTARSGNDKDAMWLGFHADNAIAGSTHSHNDGGSFSLQAKGEVFFFDLGSDDYNIPKYRVNAYRVRAEGHNLLLINPGRGQYDTEGKWPSGSFDMQFGGKAKIDYSVINNDYALAMSDVTDLWRADLLRGKRGVRLDFSEECALVQDELVLKEPSELYWFAHTRADIKISENGKKAYLTQNGKSITAEISASCGADARFSVMDAKPLKTSPVSLGQNENEDTKKLTIHLTDVKELRLSVRFYCDSVAEYKFTSLDEWK